MLSRVAEAMYWMSRYMERAEHVARIVTINSNMLIDLGELAPETQKRQWKAVHRILRLDGADELDELLKNNADSQSLLFKIAHESYLNVLKAISKARENARTIRENISAEMWETLNTLYWSLQEQDSKLRFEEFPQDSFASITHGSLLFQGVTDQTLPHSQSWQFIQLAKFLERADMICRILSANFEILHSVEETLTESPLRNIQWMGVLRSCCSIEAYGRKHPGDLDPLRLAAFLLLEDESPRNVRFAINAARLAMHGVSSAVHPQQTSAAERILGRLNAQLEFAELQQLWGPALERFLREIQDSIGSASISIENEYFLH